MLVRFGSQAFLSWMVLCLNVLEGSESNKEKESIPHEKLSEVLGAQMVVPGSNPCHTTNEPSKIFSQGILTICVNLLPARPVSITEPGQRGRSGTAWATPLEQVFCRDGSRKGGLLF